MGAFQRGYEDLVFCVRHWDAVWWLDDHWGEDIGALASREGFPPETVERLVRLHREENETLGHAIDDSHGQALKVTRSAVEEMTRILRDQTRCQCDEPRGKNSSSNFWTSEFGIRPRGGRNAGARLSVGVDIESAAGIEGAEAVFLISWVWLKSKAGVVQARTNPDLKEVVQTNPLLGRSIENKWKNTLAVGASKVLLHADNEFRIDVASLVAECLAPFNNFKPEHIEHLYSLAA